MNTQTIGRLCQIVGEANVLSDPTRRFCYSYDGLPATYVPDAVVFAQTKEQVSQIMALAYEEEFPVTPRAAGTCVTGGILPVQGGIILDLARMNRILEIDQDNLTITVEPGVITGHINAAVQKMGLFYPPDPGSVNYCTIGGNVATNAGGPRCLKYGVTRDYVLAMEAVLPNGTTIHTGAKTMKRSVGYDLTRLLVGSEGTLAVITELVLKLIPLPTHVNTILAIYEKLDDAAQTVSNIISQGIIPTTLEMMDNFTINCVEQYLHLGLPTNAEALLIIEVDGNNQAYVKDQCDAVAQICRQMKAFQVNVATVKEERDQLWKARRGVPAALGRLRPTKFGEDITVPRTQIPAIIKRIEQIREKYNLPIAVFGHAGDGNLHPNILTDIRDKEEMQRVEKAIEEMFRATVELGGTISGEHGIGIAKAPYFGFEVDQNTANLLKSIKKLFDPKNILNPGKIYTHV